MRFTIVSAPSATSTTSTVLLPGGMAASSGIPQVKTTRWGGSTSTKLPRAATPLKSRANVPPGRASRSTRSPIQVTISWGSVK
jgi:hypothetical protein